MLEELLARLGHRKVSGGTLEQAYAQAFLQLQDAPAECGFRNVQCPPGRRETAVLDDLGEVIQVVQVFHIRSFTRWNSVTNLSALAHAA
ncbi:hypothetical protein D3C75_879260 [compost metagenome]